MTRDEISRLDNLELRRAVAEARGWTDIEVIDETEIAGICPGVFRTFMAVPHWEHDIGKAWELVEEIAKDLDVVVGVDELGSYCQLFKCRVQLVAESSGSIAPEAICRAYLMAREGKS
jgi:hypothetical protein